MPDKDVADEAPPERVPFDASNEAEARRWEGYQHPSVTALYDSLPNAPSPYAAAGPPRPTDAETAQQTYTPSGDWQQQGAQGPWVRDVRQAQAGELHGERELMQVQSEVGRVTLSQSEQMRLQRLQNGMSSVQEQIDNGRISPQAGQALMGQIGQQAQPLTIRASQLPLMLMRQRYMMQQHQLGQAEALAQEGAAFRARTADQRTQHVTMPDGRTVSLLEDRQGHLHVLTDTHARMDQQTQARQDQQARQQRQTWESIYHQEQQSVQREIERFERPQPRNAEGQQPPARERPGWYQHNGRTDPEALAVARDRETLRRAQTRFGGWPQHLTRQGSPENTPQPAPAQQLPPAQQTQAAIQALMALVHHTNPVATQPAPARRQPAPPVQQTPASQAAGDMAAFGGF